jgi:mannose-6-phosphate isomerase-like protein (cupin superfamily)
VTRHQPAVALPFPPTSIYTGDAAVDAPLDQGWLLGHFKADDDLRHSAAVEVKWGEHPPGDRRAAWVTHERRTAFLILISGCFHVEFRDRTVRLSQRGAYVGWGPGVDHSWFAERESTVLTVRWPSVPGYAGG